MIFAFNSDPHFVFISVDADGNLVAANAFMQKNGYSLPVYQSASTLPQDLYSGVLPTTLIIGTDGKLVQKHEGIANYNTKDMITFLQSLAANAVH